MKSLNLISNQALSDQQVDLLTPETTAPIIGSFPLEGSRPGVILDSPEGRRWSWTQYLLQSGFAGEVLIQANNVATPWYAGVGLVRLGGAELSYVGDGKMEVGIEESGYTWGGVIYTSEKTSPTLIDGFSTLDFNERKFPIIVQSARHIPQVLNVRDPSGLLGTATCWAKGRASNPVFANTKGSLTASHVIGSGRHTITVDDGSITYSSTNAVHAPPCIDAVFLQTGWPPSAPLSFTPQQLSSLSSGDPISFSGAVSSGVTGKVTNISAHANYSGSGVPMILCHDGLGQGGDSGSLVEVNNQPTAMHLSQITLDAGGHESRTILLQQVEKLLDADLYR